MQQEYSKLQAHFQDVKENYAEELDTLREKSSPMLINAERMLRNRALTSDLKNSRLLFRRTYLT